MSINSYDISSYDINTFRVLGPGNANFSTAELKITSTTLAFNASAAAELGYPEYVIILTAPDASISAASLTQPTYLFGVSIR